MEFLFDAKPDLEDEEESYGVSCKRLKLVPSRRPVVTVSLKNLVAFSSNVDLTLRKGAGANGGGGIGKDRKNADVTSSSGVPVTGQSEDQHHQEEAIAGCHVYIADLNTPWEIFLVKNSSFQVTHLRWDHLGTKLLVGTEDGLVEIFTMSEHLLNKWQPYHEASFSGEPILTSCWLNVPRRVTINPDKLDSMVYTEKYTTNVPFSSRGFGGKPLEGCVVITGTGLIGVVVTNSCDDITKPIIASEKMLALRSQIKFADTSYSNEGDIVVVTSNDNIRQPVLISKVKVTLSGTRDKAEIAVSAQQSLFVTSHSDHSISSVQFINKFKTDRLLIGLHNQLTGSSLLLLYELVSQPITLKPRFQTNGSTTDVLNTFRWQQISQVQFNSAIMSISTLPSHLLMPVATSSTTPGSVPQTPLQSQHHHITSTLSPSIAVTLSNNSIILCKTDNLHQVSTISCVKPPGSQVGSAVQSPSKAVVLTSTSSSGDEMAISTSFSWSGSVLVALTANYHLQAYKIHPNIDASIATLLIELGMVGGCDPWDVMMCIKPTLVDSITDRLSETFARQPPPVQTHYNVKILVIKAALYRMTSGGTARINDQQTLLMLYLLSGALKALLRPAELSSKEKGPAESVSSLINSSGEQYSDLNKVLVQMVGTEYVVDTATLQSIQQLLQWCADLALKLLSTLPDLRHTRAPGWEVCKDSKAIATLRELLVLMRIWGLQRPSCLPAFRKTSENLDVLLLLFRLLTRLSVAPHDPDEGLIDECCLLPSEVQIPHHTACCPTKNLGISSSILFSRGVPHQFQFGVLPLKWWAGVETSGNWMDGLRLLWLGKNPAGVKVCNRCGCTSLINLPPRSPANKAWDQRWLKTCPCGGHWKIPAFLPQPRGLDADFLNHL